MFNTVMFFVTVFVTFGLLTLLAYFFGKEGIFAWVGMAAIIANIFTCKTVNLFGMSVTLGNALFGTVFLATDMLFELYDKNTAKKAVWVALTVLISATCLTQLSLIFIPNEFDFAHESMQTLFGILPRITLGSISMFLFSNQLDIYLFDKIREKTNGKYLWLRNNVATIISQCIENFLFYTIAFLGVYTLSDILVMAGTLCIVEIILAFLDTPFLYLIVNKKGKINVED